LKTLLYQLALISTITSVLTTIKLVLQFWIFFAFSVVDFLRGYLSLLLEKYSQTNSISAILTSDLLSQHLSFCEADISDSAKQCQIQQKMIIRIL